VGLGFDTAEDSYFGHYFENFGGFIGGGVAFSLVKEGLNYGAFMH